MSASYSVRRYALSSVWYVIKKVASFLDICDLFSTEINNGTKHSNATSGSSVICISEHIIADVIGRKKIFTYKDLFIDLFCTERSVKFGDNKKYTKRGS